MKKHIYIVFLSLALAACSNTKKWNTTADQVNADKPKYSAYQERLVNHRDSMSAVFYSGSNGVLPKEAISPVGKLNYFNIDKAFRVPAVFQKIENGKEFEMKTSTDRLPLYRVYGVLKFELEDKNLELNLYQNVEQPDYLFCPFKDKTNGSMSYGAGRYLDFSLEDMSNPVLDFNYAYNPYCAYNHLYSCPIPPVENHLDVSIPAGEKKWH
ncbi:DUF1684 domain-containing protein [Bacteroidia bacterium]|nr:DUF1684 domain-containing protein [Bacteroidia bacterium]MDB9882545.1 DUF1684 domain-containing protein [Bacteroidia bacterium]